MELGESILTKKTKIEQVNKEFETFLKVEKRIKFSLSYKKIFSYYFYFVSGGNTS